MKKISFFLQANCTIGAFPTVLRTCCPGVGGACADILAGLCGKLVLFVIYLITLLCNLLGFFWIYFAEMARTPQNSSQEGDPNYCAPEVWITANFIVNGFWVVSAIGLLMVFAQVFRFFRSAESLHQPVVLGKPPRGARDWRGRRLDV